MTEAERIRKEATKFATFETAPNEMEKYNELYSGYIAGATAENERLQQQLKMLKNDLLDALDLKQGNGPTALSMLSSELKSAQELNRELVDMLQGIYDDYVVDNQVLHERRARKLEELLNKAK